MSLSIDDRDLYVELCVTAAGYGSKIRVLNFLDDLEQLVAAKRQTHNECARLCYLIWKSPAQLSYADEVELLLAARQHYALAVAPAQELVEQMALVEARVSELAA